MTTDDGQTSITPLADVVGNPATIREARAIAVAILPGDRRSGNRDASHWLIGEFNLDVA